LFLPHCPITTAAVTALKGYSERMNRTDFFKGNSFAASPEVSRSAIMKLQSEGLIREHPTMPLSWSLDRSSLYKACPFPPISQRLVPVDPSALTLLLLLLSRNYPLFSNCPSPVPAPQGTNCASQSSNSKRMASKSNRRYCRICPRQDRVRVCKRVCLE
jgi:hypothetical protein